MKKAILFILIAFMALPAVAQKKSRAKKKAPAPIEKTAEDTAVMKLNYDLGYAMAYITMIINREVTGDFLPFFDRESFAEGYEAGLFDPNIARNVEDLMDDLAERLTEMARKGKVHYTPEALEELLAEHYPDMTPLAEGLRYEITDEGVGEFAPPYWPYTLDVVLKSSTGRIIDERLDIHDEEGWMDVGEPFSAVVDAVRPGLSFRIVITDMEEVEYFPLMAGELPVIIGEITITAVGPYDENNLSSWLARLRYDYDKAKEKDAGTRIFDHEIFSGMNQIDDDIRWQVIDQGTGPILPLDDSFCLDYTMYSPKGYYRDKGIRQLSDYVNDHLWIMFQAPRAGMIVRMYLSREDRTPLYGYDEDEIPLTVYDYEVMDTRPVEFVE